MPSTSAKQAKFMRAVSHSPKFAKKVGVSQKVGKEFEMADKKKDGPLGSTKDIIARGNRTPYEPTPKTGPDMGARKPMGPMGKKGYAKGGKVKKFGMGGLSPLPGGGMAAATPTQSQSAGRMQQNPMSQMGMQQQVAASAAGRMPQTSGRPALTAPLAGMQQNPMSQMGMRQAAAGAGQARMPQMAGSPTLMSPLAGMQPAMKKGGKVVKKAAKGGGIERKGKTKGTMVKMAKGGSIDGCAMKGKTRAPTRRGK